MVSAPRQTLVVTAAIAIVLCATSASAQYRAAVQGTVTDSTGGIVPGATVVVTSIETGIAREAVTNESGFYHVAGLAPGRYRVAVSLAGFKSTTVDGLQIDAEQQRGLDVVLEAGGIQETVTVTGGAPTIQTENGDVAGTLGTVEIQRLPQLGRDPYELIRLTPGVFGLGARAANGNAVAFPNQQGPGGSNQSIFQTENQVQVSANGQRVENNNFQLDGVTAMSQAWGGAAVVTPNQESVKEIRVSSSSYSAETGRNSGAQVQVVSQNGTNDLHGSVVFKRNTPGLNSYQKWGGPHGETPQRLEQSLSQTAASIGGPILRDRAFFFFSFEGTTRSQNTLNSVWTETPELVAAINAQRPGSIASQVLQYPGMTPPRVANVLETRDLGSLTGGLGQLVTDPAGGGLDGIPDVQRAQLEGFSDTTARQFNVRADVHATGNDLVAFSTYIVPVTSRSNEPQPWTNTARPYGDFESKRRNMVGTLLWTRTVSPTMINEARFNVTRWYFDEVASNPDMPWGIPRLAVTQAAGETLNINFGPGIGPGVFYQTTYNFRNTLTKVMGAHALKVGGDIIREQNNDKAPWAGRPTYNFGNLWSFANDAPASEGTTFFDPETGAFTELQAYARQSYFALFAQDDWKVRPNLTVNLGLRWEYFSPLTSANERIANLVLGPDQGLVGATLRTGGQLYDEDWNNFGPSVGFAWTPERFTERLVVRGGAGVGFNRLPGNRLLEARFNPPYFAGFFLTGSQIVYALANDVMGFDYPNNPSAVLTFDPETNLPTSGAAVNVNATMTEVPNPYTIRYSLETEYDLGGGWVGALGYQGSQSRKLPRTVPYQLFVTPNPRLGTVNMMLTDVNSSFNALLARVTRRYVNGLSMNAEYRFSKSIDTCSNSANCAQTFPFDQSTERGPSDFDVPHLFHGYATWDLPFLRDRDDLVGALAGGWQVSGIITASSGFPWTPVFGGALCNVAVAAGGICPQRPVGFSGDVSNSTPSNDTLMEQHGQFAGGPLNYFTPPPSGTFTDPPRPGVGRNSFRGPRYLNVDMTLTKQFRLPAMPVLKDNAALEVRMNVFNLFNTLNLTPFTFNSPSTQIENPDFGRAVSALAGRVVEFQGRFSF